MKAVDLFAGAGGFSTGATMAGCTVVWAANHWPPRLIPPGTRFHYRASEDAGGLLWHPSIHMPRWASRILLEVTEIRVERLQEISQADAIAEGAVLLGNGPRVTTKELLWSGREWSDSLAWYRELWESINGRGSWAANPWVWCVAFKPVPRVSA